MREKHAEELKQMQETHAVKMAGDIRKNQVNSRQKRREAREDQ
jgi:hypothetical protein